MTCNLAIGIRCEISIVGLNWWCLMRFQNTTLACFSFFAHLLSISVDFSSLPSASRTSTRPYGTRAKRRNTICFLYHCQFGTEYSQALPSLHQSAYFEVPKRFWRDLLHLFEKWLLRYVLFCLRPNTKWRWSLYKWKWWRWREGSFKPNSILQNRSNNWRRLRGSLHDLFLTNASTIASLQMEHWVLQNSLTLIFLFGFALKMVSYLRRSSRQVPPPVFSSGSSPSQP